MKQILLGTWMNNVHVIASFVNTNDQFISYFGNLPACELLEYKAV